MGENPSGHHQYNNQQEPYIFQETHNLQQTQDFFHYNPHYQALFQQQQRRLQDQLQQCVLGQETVVSNNSTIFRPNSVPSSCFVLNLKPPDLNENVIINSGKDGRREEEEDDAALLRRNCGAAAALAHVASSSPHYCWQNQEDSAAAAAAAVVRQPFWKPLCSNLSDGSNNSQDKEVTEQMNSSSSFENSKNRLFGELESICRNTSMNISTTEANKPAGDTSAHENMTSCVPVNAGATVNGDYHGVSDETCNGDESLEPAAVKEKKKRKKSKDELGSMAVFFEGWVHRLMDHQEILHKNFLQAIGRLDEERKEREDAWRRQELEKLEQDAAAKARKRALASSREASIVSYLEKITGQRIKLPPRTINPPNSDFQPAGGVSSGAMNVELSSGLSCMNSSNKRWPKAEVEALIQIRSGLEQKFQRPGFKGPLWEHISNAMASMGFQRNAKRCKEKWENINKYFKKSREFDQQPCSKKIKTCQYFDQLDQLYSKSEQVNNGASTSCNSSSEHLAKQLDSENQLSNQIDGLVPAGSFIQSEFNCTPSMKFNDEDDGGGDGNADFSDGGD